MTAEEKEIRDAERKALAEVRRWRREVAKETKSLSPEELREYYRKNTEKVRAMGYRVVMWNEEKSEDTKKTTDEGKEVKEAELKALT
jgi:hypothetical protein